MEIDLSTKLQAVMDYYQGYNTVWDKMDITGLSAEQINAMYNALPAESYIIDVTPSGLNLGRSYTNPFELPVVPGSDFDSNIPGGSYGGGNTFTGNVPANLELDPSTGLPVSQTAGATTAAGSILPVIADRISLAVAGVNIGAKLGLAIDSALYDLDPAWWDEHLPSINPETWSSLVGVNPVGDFFLRTLFGITNDSMTGYVSADALAYYYQMLRDSGAWSEGETTYSYDNTIKSKLTYPDTYPNPLPGNSIFTIIRRRPSLGKKFPCVIRYVSSAPCALFTNSIPSVSTQYIYVDRDPFTVTVNYEYNDGTESTSTLTSMGPQTQSGVEYYYLIGNSGYYPDDPLGNKDYLYTTPTLVNGPVSQGDVAIIFLLGDKHTTSPLDGVSGLPDSTQYPPTNITGTTLPEIRQQLQQQYPELFQDAITETTMQDDGTTSTIVYVPIPWVTEGLNPQQPITGDGRGQTDTEVDPETGDEILPITQPDEPAQPPDTGDGDTPIPVIPTGSASSLWAVYNPTQGQLDSFGAWLWSSDFVEQLKKLFADPMQAIIGVHKVFATPSTGGSQNIKCGYLDSGVSASVVTSQYTTVNCGSASLREYFGNVFDYDPFTKVSIFLPFIGIVPLNIADVMRSKITVKYKVDVITGACLAEVTVKRDGAGGILYTYGGSAIVTYPISSGSYVGAVQAALSTVIGIGSAIATGGASLGASAGMVLGGLSNAKTQVQHSGQFSGSSGAMGGKKPYLIVSRPQTRTPQKIAEYEGIPTNSIHKLSNCNGFTKVKEVHITSKTAYDNEIQEIENLLKTGVII